MAAATRWRIYFSLHHQTKILRKTSKAKVTLTKWFHSLEYVEVLGYVYIIRSLLLLSSTRRFVSELDHARDQDSGEG